MDQIYNYNEKLAVKDKAFSPLNGVTLSDGLFKKTFDNNIRFLEKLSVNKAIYWFEKKLGLPQSAEPYRGHFEDNLKGQTAGMYLIGAGNTLRWTENSSLHEGLEKIIHVISQCAEPDGFLLPISKEYFPTDEYPNYVRLLINLGLIAAGNSGNEKAFGLLRSWQDWVNRSGELRIAKYLILGFQGMVAGTNVYTTPVGTFEDIEASRENYEEGWRLGQFLLREKNCVHERHQPGEEPHAHGTELESLEGYLDLFRATGKYYYLHSVLGARSLYKEYWQHPGGGIVMCEFADSYPGCGWLSTQKSYNELCCSAFWISLHQRLHRLFPENEEYMSEIEKSLYNVVIANQQGDEAIRYFAHLDTQRSPGEQVTCCAAAGARIISSLPEYVFSVSEADIYINLYTSASIRWSRRKGDAVISMTSNIPYSSKVRISVETAAPECFALKLRIPEWADGTVKVFLNGRMHAKGIPGSYLSLERCWTNGDSIEFDLPMAWRIKKYEGAEQVIGMDRYSVEYGPLLMAVRGRINYNKTIRLNGEWDDVFTNLKQTLPLHFEINRNPDYELVPYFEIEDETFTCFPLFSKQ